MVCRGKSDGIREGKGGGGSEVTGTHCYHNSFSGKSPRGVQSYLLLLTKKIHKR